MSLRMAALGLLAQQPGSGYDLLKRFEVSMANVWPATQSQLYGELNKLAGAGLIEASAVGPSLDREGLHVRGCGIGRRRVERDELLAQPLACLAVGVQLVQRGGALTPAQLACRATSRPHGGMLAGKGALQGGE